jgi:dephospho-CoA kinase
MARDIVIGTCGTLCAGKGVIAEILKSLDCDVITLGAIVRESLDSRNVGTSRENQQDEGNMLRQKFGGQVLAERALKKHENSKRPLVIDGIRNIAEIDYLKKNSIFFLIGVDAPIEIRWKRSVKRNRDAGHNDYDRFVLDDARDKGRNEPESGQQVGLCLVQADSLIFNDQEFERLEDSKLYAQVEEIYRNILK